MAEEYLAKVLVIGDQGTGKTSFIQQYVNGIFNNQYKATIGVDYMYKRVDVDRKTVHLQLWDIAGQDRYRSMLRVYCREAVGAFVVFDISRHSTFEGVLRWKTDLDEKLRAPDGSPLKIPVVLLANKADLVDDEWTNRSQMERFCEEHGFCGWFESSAKDRVNIDEAGEFLVRKILDSGLLQASEPPAGSRPATDVVNPEVPSSSSPDAPKKDGCGC
eukprot:gnl/Trimastix_PCT/1977.p1 GENE.gnl/Trimastix_PCT/1977~~gnl/Trimastix_PCT/1977.p1  ORF type:complete len:233 (+),score=22.21 gnl/Trimastix_PCT/1977:51-701(+)